ncbi:pyocin knob domain-containing protein [Morganella morganii]|uniref:pyocin knob domain-containing protein n=1 Tax=Morganella morganii TaxID=582 RepID=UPI00301DF46B
MTKIFKIPFATQGDRTAVPDEVQADGSLSYTQGYGYDYERDQATDPAAKDIEREKMNSLFHDITGAVGEIQAFGMPVWAEEGKPYAIRSIVYHNKKAWQSKIENNNTEPAAGTAWTELKADLTAGEVGAYTKGEADRKFQPLGNYQAAGYSYSKAESDTNFQPKGNYAPAGNYALKTDVYTKTEGDGRYQAKGNYAPAGDYAIKGESYTKSESDNKYFDSVRNVLNVDLNTLGGSTHEGIYYQTQNAEATGAHHYPISEAGSLLVTRSAYGCQQEYTTFDSGRKFVRGLTTHWNGKDGPWGTWKEFGKVDMIYPVGVVIWFAQNKNPNSLFPGTKWSYIGENKTIRLANSSGNNVLSSGGSDSITLTTAHLPAHSHSFSGSTSSFDYGTKTTNSTGEHTHTYQTLQYQKGNSHDVGGRDSGYETRTTSSAGAHTHTIAIGAHSHTVSGTTGNTGNGSSVSVINAYIMLMGWYRIE